MSTTPGWPPSDPEPHNPFAAPSEDRTPADDRATGAPVPPPPSGYEAVSLLKPGTGSDAATAPTPPSPYGAAPAPYGAAPQDGPQPEAAPPSPYGATPASPYGAAPASPYGAPPSPYGAPTASPYGAAPANPYGAEPGQPYPTPGSPYGAPQGAPAYGAAPGYGQPGYPYPAPGTWGPAQPPVDALAIASIATSGAGVVLGGFTGPVGIGLGIAALRRIRRTGARGRGLAIAGIVVGSLMTLFLGLLVALIVVGIGESSSSWDSSSDAWSSDEWSGDEWTSDDPYAEDVMEEYRLAEGLLPGQCLEYYPSGQDLQDVVLVDCASAHEAEVVAQVELTGPVALDYESEDPAWDDAYEQCQAAATALVPSVNAYNLTIDVYPPHPHEWDAGGTTAYCVLSTYGGELTGSLVTGGLALDGVTVTP